MQTREQQLAGEVVEGMVRGLGKRKNSRERAGHIRDESDRWERRKRREMLEGEAQKRGGEARAHTHTRGWTRAQSPRQQGF